MIAMLLPLLGSKPARWAMGAGVALLVVLGAITWLRHDAARDARRDVAVEAAEKQEETRREGDAAARAAERDGADRGLYEGRF